MKKLLTLFILFSLFSSCSTPNPGPDKTVGGAVLGAAWGAGAGAVVGNQLMPDRAGEGTAVGAGLGIISGALTGLMYDSIEDKHLKLSKKLASLRRQNIANGNRLASLQSNVDSGTAKDIQAGVYQVFFDTDQTNLRFGAIKNLQDYADLLRKTPSRYSVKVVGHTDDTGNDQYNDKLALDRAKTVGSYLMARGLNVSDLSVSSKGAKNPIATNKTAEGRQLNRRVDVFLSKN